MVEAVAVGVAVALFFVLVVGTLRRRTTHVIDEHERARLLEESLRRAREAQRSFGAAVPDRRPLPGRAATRARP